MPKRCWPLCLTLAFFLAIPLGCGSSRFDGAEQDPTELTPENDPAVNDVDPGNVDH